MPEFLVTYYRTNGRAAQLHRVEADDLDDAARDAIDRCNSAWFVGCVEQANLPAVEPTLAPTFALYPGDA